MNPINNYFNKIYCVNLDRRQERWKEASDEFKKFSLDVERFSAVDGSKLDLSNIKMQVLKSDSLPGAVGCSMSHRNIIIDAKEKGYEKILILEDDVVFTDNLIERFEKEINSLPEDWDLFYLSANNLKPEALTKINENIWRTRFSYTTHCYAVHSRVYDVIIKGLENLDVPVDQFYKNVLQQEYNCYVIRPHLSWQREGYSDIMKGNRFYKNIKE